MKDRSLAKKRPISCAKGGSSPNGFKQSLKRPIRSFFSKGDLKATLYNIALKAQVIKPIIYQYFKAKEDISFSLMIPVVEDTGRQMEDVEKRLETGQYGSCRDLVHDWILTPFG